MPPTSPPTIPSPMSPSSGPTFSADPPYRTRSTPGAEAPMPDVLMPALSPTMEQGKLSKWLKKKGDAIKSGDVIAEIETDKATMEVEAVDEGVLSDILVPEGTDNVAVNTRIAFIKGEGETAPAGATEHKTGTQPTPRSPGTAEPDDGPRTAKGSDAEEPTSDPTSLPQPKEGYDASGEVPEGTELATMTVREALRDAMAEEMRHDQIGRAHV